MPLALEKLRALSGYGACDISDALLKLGVRGAGHVASVTLISPRNRSSSTPSTPSKVIAPASTFLFVEKNPSQHASAAPTSLPPANIPKDVHWVDMTKPDTIVILAAPPVQHSAVLGGIMAMRMKVCGAQGVVAPGSSVRDVDELEEVKLPVWAQQVTTVGSGLELKPHAVDVSVEVGGIEIKPGDIVFSDQAAGVVVIPSPLVDQVLELLPKLTGADDKVKEAVANGMTVQEAFKKFR